MKTVVPPTTKVAELEERILVLERALAERHDRYARHMSLLIGERDAAREALDTLRQGRA